MQKALDCLLRLVENPFTKKGYVDLKKCYIEAGMAEAVGAFDHLINQRFTNEVNDVHPDPQQSNNN